MWRVTGFWLAPLPIDLRCGMDRLLVLIRDQIKRDGFGGGAFIFRNRTGNRMKVLCADAQGVWLCTRRLHEGSFVWPKADALVCELSVSQFEWLVAGVDWRRLPSSIEDVKRVL